MKRGFLILLVIIFSAYPLKAQTREFKYTIRVSLDVETGDNIARNQLISRINAGFRSLNDVTVAEKGDAEFEIGIVSITLTSGYALSILVTKPQRKMLNAAGKSWAKDSVSAQLYNENFGDDVIVVHHSLLTGPTIESVCNNVVASIDVDIFEPERKSW